MAANGINSQAQAEFFKSSVLPSVSHEGRGGIKRAVENFEAIFINDLLKVMRKTTTKGGLFNSGNSGEIYSSMIDTELSKNLARGKGLGLGQMLLKQLDKDGELRAEKAFNAEKAFDVEKPFKAGQIHGIRGSEAVGSMTTKKAPEGLDKKQPVYEMPVRGDVSSGFGMRTHPIKQIRAFHRGMDISTYEGAPVYPTADGKVSYTGKSDSYGNFVEVKHDNGIVSRYAHLHSHIVSEGDVVVTSRPMAFVGNSGSSTAPHLHFEVLRDGKAVDPDAFLGGV